MCNKNFLLQKSINCYTFVYLQAQALQQRREASCCHLLVVSASVFNGRSSIPSRILLISSLVDEPAMLSSSRALMLLSSPFNRRTTFSALATLSSLVLGQSRRLTSHQYHLSNHYELTEFVTPQLHGKRGFRFRTLPPVTVHR